MKEYKRLTYKNIYEIRPKEQRLKELEDKIEDGELVSKEWHNEQMMRAEGEIECLQSEINDLKSAKEGYKQRFLDSGHRNKKLSLKLGSLKKEVRNVKTEAVKEFAEKLKVQIHKCDYVNGYAELALCEEIDELLKEFLK